MLNTVDQVVRSAIASKGRGTLHSYVLYLHFALKGLFKLKRDGGYNAKKTQKLKVTSLKTVKAPDDMLYYCLIGVPVGNRILYFIPDKSISLNPSDHEGATKTPVMSVPYDNSYNFLNYTDIYYSNGYTPDNSRQGSYLTKHFRYNEDQREFQLDGSISCEHIYIEYITTGINPCSETVISPLVADALEEFIHYREARFKHGAASAESRAAEQDYLNELDEAIASQSDLTGSGIMEAISSAMNHSIGQ